MFYIWNSKNGKLMKSPDWSSLGVLDDNWTNYVPDAWGYNTMKYAKKMSAHLRRLGMDVSIVEFNI